MASKLPHLANHYFFPPFVPSFLLSLLLFILSFFLSSLAIPSDYFWILSFPAKHLQWYCICLFVWKTHIFAVDTKMVTWLPVNNGYHYLNDEYCCCFMFLWTLLLKVFYNKYVVTRGPVHEFVHGWGPSDWPVIGGGPARGRDHGRLAWPGRGDCRRLAS